MALESEGGVAVLQEIPKEHREAATVDARLDRPDSTNSSIGAKPPRGGVVTGRSKRASNKTSDRSGCALIISGNAPFDDGAADRSDSETVGSGDLTASAIRPRTAVAPSPTIQSAEGDLHIDASVPLLAVAPADFIHDICLRLQEIEAKRTRIISAKNMLTNKAAACVRRALGWSMSWSESQMSERDRKECEARRDRAKENAKSLLAKIWKLKIASSPSGELLTDDAIDSAKSIPDDQRVAAKECAIESLAFKAAHSPLNAQQKALEDRREELALSLPPELQMRIPAFSDGCLGLIIGNTGDLRGYQRIGQVRQRMGLNPFKGMACSTIRRGGAKLSAEEWQNIGYSPMRRSAAYQAAHSLFLRNEEFKKIYRAAKAEMMAKLQARHEADPEHVAKPRPQQGHMHGHRIIAQVMIERLFIAWKAYPNNAGESPVFI